MKERLLFDAELRGRWALATRTLLIAQVSDDAENCAGDDDAYHEQQQHAFVDVLRGKTPAPNSVGLAVGLSVDDAKRDTRSKSVVLD